MNDLLLVEIEKRLDVSTVTPTVIDCVLTVCLAPDDQGARLGLVRHGSRPPRRRAT